MADEPLLDGLHAHSAQGPAGFFAPNDKRLLGWVAEALQEGERIMRADPGYPKMDEMINYVMGDQLKGPRPSYLPKMVINQTKKAIKTHASALTDIKPLFSYKSFNPNFAPQQVVLNNLIVAWWINSFADLELGESIKYALTCGAGDLFCEYDPTFLHGDNRLIARDPRDTLPIRPSTSRSLQDWEGVIIREAKSVNVLRGSYPEAAHYFRGDNGGKWGQVFTRFKTIMGALVSPASTLDGLKTGPKATSAVPQEILYRVYLNDRSLNLTGQPVLMGKPGTAYSYYVAPGDPLYPRKRLIVCTEKVILYDGPNPYWHGMYPVSRFKPDPWPWLFLGMSLTNDLLPVNDGINNIFNNFLNIFDQAANRTQVSDANAMPESQWRRFDPRKPGSKVKVKASMGESFKLLDPAQLPPWSLEFARMMFQKFEEMSGTANLQQLMQLRQMPSADTIQKYYDSLTPELKMEGRLLEAFIRDTAEQVKCNIFQYYSVARRVLILGDAGKTLSDFDYDPNTLVPAMKKGEANYIAELDVNRSRDERAQFFRKLFTFHVAPNSILAMHAQENKMLYLQLSRQGYMDFWTLMEMLEIPNVGAPPPIPLPVRSWTPKPDPVTNMIMPPPMEMRVPLTITERLQAQMMMGIGQTQSPAGRPASGQAPPKMEEKSDGEGGTRQTITESEK